MDVLGRNGCWLRALELWVCAVGWGGVGVIPLMAIRGGEVTIHVLFSPLTLELRSGPPSTWAASFALSVLVCTVPWVY